MPAYKIIAPNGKTYQVEGPAGASDEDVRAEVLRQFPDAADDAIDIIDYGAAGIPPDVDNPKDDSALRGVTAGVLKPVDNATKAIMNIPGMGAVDRLGQAIGLPSANDAIAGNEAARANNSRTGYQILGNIAGTLPLSALPGGAFTQGAAGGALLSDADSASGVGMDAALGGLGGKAAGMLLSGLGGAATGVKDAGLRALNSAGIPLTLGQIAGAGKGLASRTINKAEEALTSVPILGDMINTARDRGTQGFNLAIGNRILSNIGEKLQKGAKPGYEMLDEVGQKLSDRYQQIVPKLSASIDQDFAIALTAARDLADEASRAGPLEKIVNNVFGNRLNGPLSPGVTISGQRLKDAEAELKRRVAKYARSTGDEGQFGEALDMVRQALRDAVRRSNPQHADELQALNTGWAQLKSARDAVRAGGQRTQASGEFTPGAMLRQSGNKGYRDELSEAATRVLPNSTPDSGTARRGLTALGSLGTAGAGVASLATPSMALPAAAASLYTKPGQTALNALAFGARPKVVSAAAQAYDQLPTQLKNMLRYAPVAAPAAITNQQK